MYGSNYNIRFLVFARTVVRERRDPFEISSHEADITREWVMQLWLYRQKPKIMVLLI